MLQLSSVQAVCRALAAAHTIDVSAYTLHRGPVLDAIEGAARSGAHVTVTLEGRPRNDASGSLARWNGRLARRLHGDGATVNLAQRDGKPGAQPAVHAKAIVADGTMFLDDRNWNAGDLVLSDDGAHDHGVATTKRAALHEEARLLNGAAAGDDVIVETEAFGAGNEVFDALAQAAARGAKARLLVNEREARGAERIALRALASRGVAVRVCSGTDKFALANGRAWVGSANASPAFEHPDRIDWGARSADPAIVSAVRSRLESHWSAAKPL